MSSKAGRDAHCSSLWPWANLCVFVVLDSSTSKTSGLELLDQIRNREQEAVVHAGELLTRFLPKVKSNWKLDADKRSRGSETK